MDFQQEFLSDVILCAKYEFHGKLGQGCFGKIYKVKNKELKIFTALKLEIVQNSGKKSMLQNESLILKTLKGKPFTSKFYSYGQWNLGTYLEIQLLEKDLNCLVQKAFTIDQISNIMVKLIQSLAILHNSQILHQDIKPQNIMLNSKGQYVFIDFGISKKLKQASPQNNDYGQKSSKADPKRIKGFIGTPRYASIQAHKGLQQSKKDDLQSLMYNIAYLYFKKLPWLSLKVTGNKKIQQIKLMKLKKAHNVFQQMGMAFSSAYEYIKKMDHMEEPNYKHLISIFRRSSTMIVDSFKNNCLAAKLNQRQFLNKLSNSEDKNRKNHKRSQNKKYSLNLNQNNGQYLQLPSFIRKFQSNSPDGISQKSLSQKNSNYITNSMTGSMQGSKAVSIRVYNQMQQITKDQSDSFSKDMNLNEQDNRQPGVANISRILNTIEMKNPFTNNF